MLETLKEASHTMEAQGVYLPGAKGAFTAPLLVCKRLLGGFAPRYWDVLGFWVSWEEGSSGCGGSVQRGLRGCG